MGNPTISDEALAAISLLQKNGMGSFELRFSLSEQGDDRTVWMAIGNFADRWEVAAARRPSKAVLRLAESIVDGALCNHCGKVCGLDEDYMHLEINEACSDIVCWYLYDPELKVFRRSCEGDERTP